MSMDSLPSYVYLAPAVSFVSTWMVVVWLLRRFSDRILDHPNERSLHRQPVPRTGGIGVAAGIAVSALSVSPSEWWPLWVGAVVLVVVSFVDDLVGLPVIGRLIVHLLAAGGLVGWFLVDDLGWAGAAFAIIGVAWMVNLYNFMDGMDGLAGGMTLFGFGFLAMAAWVAGDHSLMLVSLSIAAAAGAFLWFNFHPARIFLGDAGSTTLGFLAAGLGLIGWKNGSWSLGVPLLVFSPFIVDASVTLARRLLRGEKVWQAHRSHYYQRLALAGWGHRKTASVEYGLMILCGLSALACQSASGPLCFVIIGAVAVLYLAAAWLVTMVEHKAARRGAVVGWS
ncbi:Glycosyl transferase family protein [Candidatus Nitrospira inopinata]|uniref:Glycosyl transferase family protein n=1 Tax=Candidatus Nitrospira inopinata TaxID=1715989 RepID=A0A0S4KUG7_9BACT|nr:Glycosyl transferase family protein [Candidatus Nitrospira inopinata]